MGNATLTRPKDFHGDEMSELQISLIAIGILVVLAVYGYGTLQQRRYRNRVGAAFSARHGDALYQGALGTRSGGPSVILEEDIEQAVPELHTPVGTPDEPCNTLDAETDYIGVLFAESPLSPRVLAPLWQRRFDFGKGCYVCGVPATGGPWEKVVAESPISYVTLRLALQLADRNGAVSAAQLTDFRDLLRDIADDTKAEVNLPDVAEAAASAQRLDAFCAEVDHMIGLNILPAGEQLLHGSDVWDAAVRCGMALQADGAFHLLDAEGRTLFSLGNFDNTPFQHHTLGQTPVIGLSLQMDVPRVEQPTRRFNEMVVLARVISADLGAAVVDDHRMALGDAAIAIIRSQVAAIEKKMLSYPLIPGSALARRVFS